MAALEQASTEADIGLFADFLGGPVAEQMQQGA
jgi:hypothetical protein